MIQQIDRNSLRLLTAAMLVAMEKVATEHGVSISYKGSRFTAANATLKFEVATKGDNGEVKARERETFKTQAVFYGLNPAMLDDTFTFRGNKFTVTGLVPSRHKYPLNVRRSDGKQFKMDVETVRRAFAAKV